MQSQCQWRLEHPSAIDGIRAPYLFEASLPDAAHRLINLSLCFESKGEADKAIEVVERALAISPDNPRYMLLLADFLIKTEKKSVAKDVLEKILELEPTNSLAREKLMQLKF